MREEFKDIVWTYGSHEPMSMYLRARRRGTAGLKGGARWVPAWHRYFDSEENVAKMAEMGLNFLHCRFYKGMGWEFEKDDFPNVVAFTERCHRHGIKVLGYVQLGTLYYESMRYEIPDLEDWAAYDENDRHILYGKGDYFRWMPCMTQPKFWEYLKRMVTIGVTQAHFDGIMLDNCISTACHCPRCKARFREFLKAHCDPADFGIRGFDFVEPPAEAACTRPELEDPLVIAWREFQAELFREGFKALYEHTKSMGPELIVCGNVAAIARKDAFRRTGVDYFRVAPYFDILMDQNGNEPMLLPDGTIVNRVRDCMMGEAIGRDLFVLTDGAGDVADTDPRIYATTMMEAKVFQTLPTDRIIMIPDGEGVLTWKSHPERVDALATFQRVSAMHREAFFAENYAPVRLLYSIKSQHLSASSYDGFVSAEEVLLRMHVPFGLAIGDGESITLPADCQTLLLFGARCLGDGEIAAVKAFAEAGGRVVMDMDAGRCDGENREIGVDRLAGIPNAIRVPNLLPDIPNAGWRLEVRMPDNPHVLADELPELPFDITAPQRVFIRVNRLGGRWIVHFINYSPEPCPVALVRMGGMPAHPLVATFEHPELRPADLERAGVLAMPEFDSWAMAVI